MRREESVVNSRVNDGHRGEMKDALFHPIQRHPILHFDFQPTKLKHRARPIPMNDSNKPTLPTLANELSGALTAHDPVRHPPMLVRDLRVQDCRLASQEVEHRGRYRRRQRQRLALVLRRRRRGCDPPLLICRLLAPALSYLS